MKILKLLFLSATVISPVIGIPVLLQNQALAAQHSPEYPGGSGDLGGGTGGGGHLQGQSLAANHSEPPADVTRGEDGGGGQGSGVVAMPTSVPLPQHQPLHQSVAVPLPSSVGVGGGGVWPYSVGGGGSALGGGYGGGSKRLCSSGGGGGGSLTAPPPDQRRGRYWHSTAAARTEVVDGRPPVDFHYVAPAAPTAPVETYPLDYPRDVVLEMPPGTGYIPSGGTEYHFVHYETGQMFATRSNVPPPVTPGTLRIMLRPTAFVTFPCHSFNLLVAWMALSFKGGDPTTILGNPFQRFSISREGLRVAQQVRDNGVQWLFAGTETEQAERLGCLLPVICCHMLFERVGYIPDAMSDPRRRLLTAVPCGDGDLSRVITLWENNNIGLGLDCHTYYGFGEDGTPDVRVTAAQLRLIISAMSFHSRIKRLPPTGGGSGAFPLDISVFVGGCMSGGSGADGGGGGRGGATAATSTSSPSGGGGGGGGDGAAATSGGV